MADTHHRAADALNGPPPPVLPAADPMPSLKRRASESFGDRDDGTAKRVREASPSSVAGSASDVPEEKTVTISGGALADDLEQDLMCGCCSALLYRPVIVNPCQHYFCGSCLLQWVRNGGTSCPACRSISNSVTSSRVLQLMVDILLRHDPTRARTQRERDQADAIYRPNQILRIPPPRELSPEPTIPPPGDWIHPCPHCTPGNRWGWTCPQPIPEPTADSGWLIDDGTPPGHGKCGNCENYLALSAPTTNKCDFCLTTYCGINVQGRCSALSLFAQHMEGIADLGDFIQHDGVYDAFSGNAVEVDYLVDYMASRNITPRSIYHEIIEHIQSSPRKFAPLIEQEVFVDIHGSIITGDLPADAPRNRICRNCTGGILIWGLRDWWARERRKGYIPESVSIRPDCDNGENCMRQHDHAHCKDFNHIIAPPAPQPQQTMAALAAAPPPLLSDLDFPPLSLQPHIPDDSDEEYNVRLTPPPMLGLPMPPATSSAPAPATSAPATAPMSRLPLAHVTFISDEPPSNANAARELEDMMQHIDQLHSAAERDMDMLTAGR